MAYIYVMQNSSSETAGTIEEAVVACGLEARYVRAFAGEPVPTAMDEAAGLVLMGGPMAVYEQDSFPFLRDELRLIEAALAQGRPVLGVCLGSQLLASALGAGVSPGTRKELGWHAVRLTDAARDDALWRGVEPEFMAFHWHGDVYDLPHGAVSLASSDLTDYQAFRYGESAYGVLFHAEVTAPLVSGMVAAFEGELRAAGGDPAQVLSGVDAYLPGLRRIGETVFGRWAGMAGAH